MLHKSQRKFTAHVYLYCASSRRHCLRWFYAFVMIVFMNYD